MGEAISVEMVWRGIYHFTVACHQDIATDLVAHLTDSENCDLGVGEAEVDDTINNPWHPDPDENWSPPGTKYVDGELVFIED
ncbi:MAG: hypothetical protein WBA77_22390 [Microcoleaceae cyanobacterium]